MNEEIHLDPKAIALLIDIRNKTQEMVNWRKKSVRRNKFSIWFFGGGTLVQAIQIYANDGMFRWLFTLLFFIYGAATLLDYYTIKRYSRQIPHLQNAANIAEKLIEAKNLSQFSLLNEQFNAAIDAAWPDKDMKAVEAFATPDKRIAAGEHNGFHWVILHNGMGYRCGYIMLPKSHPWYGKGYDDIEADCHGGLTYADTDKEHGVHWIGFDCAHCHDAQDPTLPAECSMPSYLFGSEKRTIKTTEYVRKQCESLCEQAYKAIPFNKLKSFVKSKLRKKIVIKRNGKTVFEFPKNEK